MTRFQQIDAQHPRIRQLVSIQRNTAPNRHKLFMAEGLWAHNLLLTSETVIDAFFWCPEAAYGDEARKRAEQVAERANTAYQISAKTLERISERDKPDGLVSLAALPQWTTDDVNLPENALVIVADGMEIPGNLGTLIRTFDACGGDCIVLTNRRTRLTHPKLFRASQGMVLTTPIVEFDEPEAAAEWLRHWDVEVYLCDTRGARNYREYDYSRSRTAFVLGAERYGIAKGWYQPDFQRVFVPMLGMSDSLNVSISAAVMLYEARAPKAGW